MSAWFASERIVFNRHKGRKWLVDILDDVTDKVEKVSGYKWVKETVSTMFSRSSDSVESAPPPYLSPTTPLNTTVIIAPRLDPTSPTKPAVQPRPGHEDLRNSGEATARPSDATHVAPPTTPPSTPDPGTEVSAARARFRALVRSAIMVNRLIGIGDEVQAKVLISLKNGKAADRKPEAIAMPRSSRVAGLVPRLQNMAPTQDIAAHVALVRHMQASVNLVVTFVPANFIPQFSPDGKFLATCSWDRTAVIFHVGVCLIEISLWRMTERLVRNNSLPIVCCYIPPDSLVRLYGEAGSFEK